MILFRDNVSDAGAAARAHAPRCGGAGGRPVVAVDQEGGEIRIVPWAPPRASGARSRQRRHRCARDAEAAARALHAAGITVSLAPVGDVPSVAGAALGGRAFSRDPRRGGRRHGRGGGRLARGRRRRDRQALPGPRRRDGQHRRRRRRRSRARAPQLEATDLPPFAAAIRAGVPLVMVGHARYPALDADRIASQSERDRRAPAARPARLPRRRRHGLDGGAARRSPPAPSTTVSERAVRAGADLVLLTGQGSYRPSTTTWSRVARRSPAFRARVRESAARVLALKRGARRRAEAAILRGRDRATPNIGVTCNVEVVRYGGLWTEPAAMVPLTYVRAIARAGGRPLLLAPTPADLADPAELLDLLDGVLVTGGADLDPASYGEQPHPETAAVIGRPRRVRAAARAPAAERDLPCLGICRGMQVVNVAYGGALEQHLRRPARARHPPRRRRARSPTIRSRSSRRASPRWPPGATRVAVKSYHHQGVARVGDGLRVTARAAGDGTVEAVEDARPALHARRALAPRGGRGRPPDRRVRARVQARAPSAARVADRRYRRRRPRSLGASGNCWNCRAAGLSR